MGKHKDTCRLHSCTGCGADSDRAKIDKLENDNKELKLCLEFVDRWLENTLGASVSVPEVRAEIARVTEEH